MKGDIILIEEWHREAAIKIVAQIRKEIEAKKSRYVITVAGESGSGKSETAHAIQEALALKKIKSVILGQDDYFHLPPRSNDSRRRENPDWLGPHMEVKLELMDQNLKQALEGVDKLVKPLVDYDNNTILEESHDLSDIKVVIAEGTYTSLLRNVDIRIFIDQTFEDSYSHRKKRNRGDEVSDPFIEAVLSIEHKIIAGHKHLADVVINRQNEVIFVE